ncbi:M48 family metalloprotease [Pontibacter sp. FD36]|uniref:M48 family metallopeptidase n=1 Tax=Pontibacter sp. FD36 TaxID=2789860 RepID=UPI0018A916C9|nr:M48 family metallopeptidase [Pontibacter sp. FD36]MBF8964967.1 M48 family metalloprotease [Pontibacter sp. FD36]
MKQVYPESPQCIPAGYTLPPSSYKSQVVYVLLAMLVFLVLYLAMVALAGYLLYLAVLYPMETVNRWTILLKLGAIGMAGMLFGFMLKFLFKKHDTNNPLNVEITEDEHPQLFSFIRQLCAETNAPLPHKVFVNHEINACVFYNSTILSLFLPVKKNLLIGLGLVNSINLTEFKAVLAHEFGHFSQSSMKLGSYVYMANSIIQSIVYERDKWDELLEKWKNSNIQLAVFGWLLMPVVWLIRKFMALIYQAINLVNASLSRQMEYNADRVAVSVTGSDAIVNALYRLGPASEAFDHSNSHLTTAIDNKIYTSNLFYHQSKAAAYLSQTRESYRQSLLENLPKHTAGARFIFSDEDGHLAEMYSSHPSNYKREQNAKATYFAGIEDERSPWLLFNEPEKLAETVTQNLLRVNLQLHPNITFTPAEEVQDFVEAEQQETTFKAHYLGVYDNRLLTELDLSDPEALVATAGITSELLPDALKSLYGAGLQQKMEELSGRYKDIQTLSLILQKQDKRKTYTLHNGFSYEPHEAQALLEQRLQEFPTDQDWYQRFDTKVFAVHYLLTQTQPAQRAELLQRYTFLVAWVKQFSAWQQEQQNLQNTIDTAISKGSHMSEKEGKWFATEFRRLRDAFEAILKEADTLQFPALQNVDTAQSVRKYLLQEELIWMSADSLQGEELNMLINQTVTVAERMQRVYTKCLGSLLSLQEQLVTVVEEKELV